MTEPENVTVPGGALETEKMPGHWVLARLGKRVLRPGGLEVTQAMLQALDVGPTDSVVEFAPGLGLTARLTLSRRPASYTAVERDETAAAIVRRVIAGPNRQCRVGNAEATGLPEACATVVYGEAMLSMQSASQKGRVIREAGRLLRPGGRYGIHEICYPDDIEEGVRREIEKDLSLAIRVGVRPLTGGEWKDLLRQAELQPRDEQRAPLHLLEPGRLIRDEGLSGACRFVWNLLRDSDARRRVLAMRAAFRKHEKHLGALMLVSIRLGEAR